MNKRPFKWARWVRNATTLEIRMGFFEEIHDLFADLVVSHSFQASEFSIDDSGIGSHKTPNAMISRQRNLRAEEKVLI
jgi:hypothetical protein